MLAGILRRDPTAQVVLIRSLYPYPDEMLRERFSNTMPDVAERIVFIRQLSQSEFLGLLLLADVMLDPFPYGGCMSSLEAFSCGLPIVTLPTELLRGRFTKAFCERLGVTECIAHDAVSYIDIAVRLANDRPYRQHVKDSIVANQSRLFGDESAVEDWIKFLRAVTVHRRAL